MEHFRPIFQLLNDVDARYIVVGGIAAILHGYVRATSDIDLVIDFEREEAKKVIDALTQAGFVPHAPVEAAQFADPDVREKWITEKGMQVFSMYRSDNPLFSVDLFVREPLPFSGLWERSKVVDIGTTQVRICSLQDLIELKRISGRDRDLADIAQLTKIQNYERK